MHVLWWNANDATFLNDFWILPDSRLNNLKILYSNLIMVSAAGESISL